MAAFLPTVGVDFNKIVNIRSKPSGDVHILKAYQLEWMWVFFLFFLQIYGFITISFPNKKKLIDIFIYDMRIKLFMG